MSIQEFIEIVQNEDRMLIVTLQDKDGNRFDITDAEEIIARFQKTDGAILTKKLTPTIVVEPPSTTPGGITIVSGPGGQLSIELLAADTALLKKVDRGDFEIVLTLDGGDIRIVQFEDKLTVKEQLFAA